MLIELKCPVCKGFGFKDTEYLKCCGNYICIGEESYCCEYPSKGTYPDPCYYCNSSGYGQEYLYKSGILTKKEMVLWNTQ